MFEIIGGGFKPSERGSSGEWSVVVAWWAGGPGERCLNLTFLLPPVRVTLTKRRVYTSLFLARPLGTFFFSWGSTLGVCDLTLPARARAIEHRQYPVPHRLRKVRRSVRTSVNLATIEKTVSISASSKPRNPLSHRLRPSRPLPSAPGISLPHVC